MAEHDVRTDAGRGHAGRGISRAALAALSCVVAALVAAACGSSSGSGSSQFGGSEAGSGGNGSGSGSKSGGSGANSGAGAGSSGSVFVGSGAGSSGTISTGTGSGGCLSAEDCPSGKVCDTTTHKCKAGATCTSNGDCPEGAICVSGTCTANTSGGPCGTDANCITGETCSNGFCGCGGQLYGAANVPPNVLIVLDRSSSMNQSITGGTKWTVAKAAISTLTTQYAGKIDFGLMLFPGTNQSCSQGGNCKAGAVFVDVGANNETAVNTFLGGANTCSFGTPTAEALTALESYSGLKDTTRADYILLITDGQSTCANPVPVVGTLFGQTPSVKTFVVGFGSGVDPTELTNMATAGGTGTPSTPYFQADDPTSLAAAFNSIAGQVLSCTYTLSPVPPDANKLNIYFDGDPVSRDPSHAAGWDYDGTTQQLNFYGTDCLSLQQGLVDDLTISYGCPASSSAATGGGTCGKAGDSCTVASDCCGGQNCLGGICKPPAPPQ